MIAATTRPKLPSVTLVAVTSVALGPTVAALRASMEKADFGDVLLLSDERPRNLDPTISWRRIEKLGSRLDYSQFMLRNLVAHIVTDHALCVQWDGFVVNGGAWRSEFLDYDYVGAVWPHFDDGYNVGNGGFSLRSRRLLDACRELPAEDVGQPEDIVICRRERPRLEEQGIRFAPPELAARFSYERTSPTGTEFGFHGAFNLVRYLPTPEALMLFRSLGRGMLARNERWELFRWALARGRLSFAQEMLRRIVRG